MPPKKKIVQSLRSVADIFAPKRKAIDVGEENNDSDSDSTSHRHSDPKPSKQIRQISFDLKLKHVKYANEIDWSFVFDFDFQFAGTSSNQIDSERGETASTSKLNVRLRTFFHYSAIRSSELKKIATEHNLHLLNMPKIFEIRWTQFTYSLVRSVLVSWNTLVIYLKNNEKDAVCAGFYNYLSKLENVELIAFLADVLFAFGRFQKKLQSDQLTLTQGAVQY